MNTTKYIRLNTPRSRRSPFQRHLFLSLPFFYKLILGLLLCFTVTSLLADTNIEIALHRGHLLYIKQKPKTIFLSDPTIADIQMSKPGLIYITSKKIGETDLYILDHRNKAILKARIFVVPSLTQLRAAIKRIAPNENIHVNSIKHNIILSGTVTDPEKAEQIFQLVNHSIDADTKVLNHLKLDHTAQIYLKVKVVELSRDLSQALGLSDWRFSYKNTGLLLFGIDSGNLADQLSFEDPAFGRSQNFDVNALISTMDRENLLKILAEPNLSALSGKKASFLAGGEFPIIIPSQASNANTVEFKKFGVSLEFIPTLLSRKKINLVVSTEVSSLSPINSTELFNYPVPALETRKASTTVELNSGQSFAIAGLLQNDIRLAVNKFPGLGDIPILGKLFRSRRYQNKQTELVIIVTPYLVKPFNGKFTLPTEGVTYKDFSKIKKIRTGILTLLLS